MTKRTAARMLLVLGVLLVSGGGWLLLTRAQSQEVTHVAALAVVTPQTSAQLPDGAQLLLEGRLVARERLGPEGFVVYTEQYFLRKHSEGANQGREQWGDHSVPRPLVALEADGHAVDVCGRDYRLTNPLHTWQSELVPRSGDLGREATLRRAGFKAGDSLTVDGRAVGASGRRCVDANALFGGDHRAYLEHERHGVVVLRVVGGVLSGLGALLLSLVLKLRRFL